MSARHAERGAALIVVLAAIVLLTTLAMALVLATSSETMIAANFRAAHECAYAADAAFERALIDLRPLQDFTPALTGALRSSFADGPAGGTRTLPDGTTVDLTAVGNLANCSRTSACSDSDLDRATAARPWGSNNPRWQLYAYGRLSDAMPFAPAARYYVVVFVGDDAAENDGQPLVDGADPGNPGAGVLAVRVEAFGPRGVHARLEATIARPAVGEAAQVVSWREIR
jgi:hypothetical protein